MMRRGLAERVRAALTLLGVAAPFGLAFVLRGLPASDLGSAGLAWVVPVLATALTVAATVAAMCGLVIGLRRGSLMALLWSGASAAVAAGALAMASGRETAPMAVGIAATFAAVAAASDRLQVLVHGRMTRLGIAAAVVILAGAGATADVIPVLASAAQPLAPALLLVGAGLAVAGAIATAGRPASVATGLIAVGAGSLWMARGADATLVLALLSLLVASLLFARSLLDAREVDHTIGADASALPALADHVTDGLLRFDGRLRLRSWNRAASRLLVLDDAAVGTGLEDLLGLTLAQLPRLGEPHSAATVHELDVSLHRDEDGLTVVLRDPGATRDADRLGRELRATIEELLQARRTIDLQRTELERAATVDPLTGVASRSAIIARLDAEVSESRRYQHTTAIVLLDIDGLAGLNAAQGIASGDAVLREVALRVRLRVRAADALGRFGSDGFLAVLPHTDEAGAETFASVLRQRIAGRAASIDGADITITISCGVAVMRPDEETDRDGLLARAGEALTSARSAGGNAVAVDRRPAPARPPYRRATEPAPNEAAHGKES